MDPERIEALMERFERAVEAAERRARVAGKRLLTTREAVELGLLPSASTAARWRMEGIGPPYRKKYGVVLYDPEEVKAWWDHNRVLTIDEVRQRAGGGGR
ncbi:hypothetical protein [Deferrisoma camini]|uniref:hypothetical protein n=1 Tax=Deferrisoma camini TaxID=1035120 RepID=UPI00046CC828|nr:hypothetical protein [Deferrisoma camini]